MSRKRRIWAGIVGVVIVAVAILSVRYLWHRDTDRTGHVSAYHVVDDDTAFLIWSVSEEGWTSSGWLSRIDRTGHTVWLRKLPAPVIADVSFQVGNGVIGVRYTHSEGGVATNLSMIAYTFDGERLWDRVLAPYHPQTHPEYGLYTPSSPMDVDLIGTSIGDYFVEWTNSETEITLTVLEQRTGHTTFTQVVGIGPSAAFGFGDRLLWLSDGTARGFTGVMDPGASVPFALNMLDVNSKAIAQVASDGPGCVFEDAYLTVVARGETKSLISYPGGNLGAPHVIADRFDPIGDGRSYSVHSCGRSRDGFVFNVHTTRDGHFEALVVITDSRGVPLRSISLPLALTETGAASLPERFSTRAPLSGDVNRFVPMVVWNGRPINEDVLVMLDLEDLVIEWRAPQPSQFYGALFSQGTHSYLIRHGAGRDPQHLSVFDEATGELKASTRASSRAGFDGLLVPSYFGPKTVWLVSMDRTRLGRPPLTVLDAASLRPVYSSEHIRITDETAELAGTMQR